MKHKINNSVVKCEGIEMKIKVIFLLNSQGRRVSNPTISKTKYALTNGRENTFLPKK